MGLYIGNLRQRVTLMCNARSDNGKGGYSNEWQPLATVWAEVIGQNGREAVIGQALQGISVYRITIRYRADLTDADQVKYGAIDLNIRSISDPDGLREQLQILADTGSAQATS